MYLAETDLLASSSSICEEALEALDMTLLSISKLVLYSEDICYD